MQIGCRKQRLKLIKKEDSLPVFPRNAVQTSTETFLTSEIETGSGEPRPSGRPISIKKPVIYKDFSCKDQLYPHSQHNRPMFIPYSSSITL